jgi:transposase
MARYLNELKEAVLKKLLPPLNMAVTVVAKQEGISEQPLYNWRKRIRSEGKPVPGKTKTSGQWSSEEKLSVVIEIATFNEVEISTYCREKGLYSEQVKSWKQDLLGGVSK